VEGRDATDAEPADRAAIRRLVDEYAAAADARDGERFAAAFAPDGVLVASPTSRYEGTAELATVPGKLARYDRTHHVVVDHHAEVATDGVTATAVTSAEAHHLHHVDGVEHDRLLRIRYHDRFVRTAAAGWRIAERRLEIVAIEDAPTR
jgi:uncharacterized protein (TIGR02246 family)